jgi:phosphoglycerol transferase MdoB-like AlkP superfamily enzyme
MIDETLRQNKRLFLSHFTSTTHHPWGTPEGFSREEYFGELHKSQHEHMDGFLNANRFVDTWLGELMNMLGKAGIANETLTVFVGDQYVPCNSLHTSRLTTKTAAKHLEKTAL